MFHNGKMIGDAVLGKTSGETGGKLHVRKEGERVDNVVKKSNQGLSGLEQLINEALEGYTETRETANLTGPDEGKSGEEKDYGTEEDRDGSVEIKNGKVIVTNPAGNGRFPAVIPGDNVEIYVNGQKIEGFTIVNDKDQIEIRVYDVPPEVKLDVQLTQDKMKAYLLVKRKPGKRFIVADTKPQLQARVAAKCIEVKPRSKIDVAEIIELLGNNGIVYGINAEAIYKAIDSEEEELKVEVAAGVLPSGVEDGEIRYNFSGGMEDEKQKNPYGEGKILSVSPGDVLAVKKPAVEGKPGIDVTGQAVLPRKPRDPQLLVREGAKLVNDGTVAVATIAGRPVIEGFYHKFLSVRPAHVVKGDVDIGVGNIKFKGDVIVTGSVLDGFKIEAGGNIEVFGDVSRAKLYANGNIYVHKKVITSYIRAGGFELIYKEIYPLLDDVADQLENLCKALKILKNRLSYLPSLKLKKEGQLVQLLVDFKYKDLPAFAREVV